MMPEQYSEPDSQFTVVVTRNDKGEIINDFDARLASLHLFIENKPVANRILFERLQSLEVVGRKLVGARFLTVPEFARIMHKACETVLVLNQEGDLQPPLNQEQTLLILGNMMLYHTFRPMGGE